MYRGVGASLYEKINGKGFTTDYKFIENRFVSYGNDPVVLTHANPISIIYVFNH